MLEVAAGDAELLPLAFLHPNGDVAVLLINQGTSEKALALVSLVGQERLQLGLDRGDFRFGRREVRERTGWGDTQLCASISGA